MSRVFWLYALPGVLTFIGSILAWYSLQGLPRVIPQKGEVQPTLGRHVLIGLVFGIAPVVNWISVIRLIAYGAERFQAWWQKRQLQIEVQERLRATREEQASRRRAT